MNRNKQLQLEARDREREIYGGLVGNLKKGDLLLFNHRDKTSLSLIIYSAFVGADGREYDLCNPNFFVIPEGLILPKSNLRCEDIIHIKPEHRGGVQHFGSFSFPVVSFSSEDTSLGKIIEYAYGTHEDIARVLRESPESSFFRGFRKHADWIERLVPPYFSEKNALESEVNE